MLHPATRRIDSFAWNQLHASIAVVRVYIDDALRENDRKEAQTCIRQIFEYLRSDKFGRGCFCELGVDLLDIIRAFVNDVRLDERYRKLTVASMISQVESRRQIISP